MNNIFDLLKTEENIKKIEKHLSIYPKEVIHVIPYYIKKNNNEKRDDYLLNKIIDIFFDNRDNINYFNSYYENFINLILINQKYDLLKKFDMNYLNKDFNYKSLFVQLDINVFLNLNFEDVVLEEKFNILLNNFKQKKLNFYEKTIVLKIKEEELLIYFLNKINFKEDNYSFLTSFIKSEIDNKIKIKYLNNINNNILSNFLPKDLLDVLNSEKDLKLYKQKFDLLKYYLPKMNLELNDFHVLRKVLLCEKDDVVDLFIKNIKDDKCLPILEEYASKNWLYISDFKFKLKDKLLKDKLETELVYEIEEKRKSVKRKI